MGKVKTWNVDLSVAILKAAADARYTDGLDMYVAKALRKPGNNAFHRLLADIFDPKKKTALRLVFRPVGKAPRPRTSRPVQCPQGLVPRVEIAQFVFDKLGRPIFAKDIIRGQMGPAVSLAAEHFGISPKIVRDCFSQSWRRLANVELFGEALGSKDLTKKGGQK